jgi:hypothetical protein
LYNWSNLPLMSSSLWVLGDSNFICDSLKMTSAAESRIYTSAVASARIRAETIGQQSSPPWSTSCRSTRRRAGPARRTRQSCGAYPPSCRRGSIGRTRRYRSAGGSRPGRVSGAHGITTQTIQHGSHRFDPP